MDKYFIITIDTEGDNLWAIKNTNNSLKRITNENGKYIERFQILCEKYHFIPTYLTNYEMALSTPYIETARHALAKGTCEVGMHLHAFNNPPSYELPNRGGKNKAYAGEYPKDILDQKIDYITKLLQDTFQVQATSHRGGRWYLTESYLEILKKHGYFVDCTVTPGVNWISNNGQTLGSHGIDYNGFPSYAYQISLDNMKKKGSSGIVEVPVTLSKKTLRDKLAERQPFASQKKVEWLRPNGKNIKQMLELVQQCNVESKREYIEFMIHSSELMPGGSPTFQTSERIEQLYADMDELFSFVSETYKGISLSNYGRKILVGR